MGIQSMYLPELALSGVIPTAHFPIGPAQAWLAVLALLILCCALLWLVTEATTAAQQARSVTPPAAADGKEVPPRPHHRAVGRGPALGVGP
jgi:hypothetical protein